MKNYQWLGLAALVAVAVIVLKNCKKPCPCAGTKKPASEKDANFLNLVAGAAGSCPQGQSLQVIEYRDKSGNWVKKVICAPTEVE